MRTKFTSIKLVVAGCLVMLASALSAATITVSSTADSGAGTLRAALASAANGDTIDAAGVTGTILLTSGELLVAKSVTIIGPGPANLAVDGNAAGRVFNISGTVVTIAGLTITNGKTSGSGGGIYTGPGSLTVSNCTLSGNSASGQYGSGGAASGCTLKNCTLTGNSATGTYGSGGGAANCTLNSCTLTGNSATGTFGSGGGASECTLNNCTLTSNSASGQYGSGGGASFRTLNNCILYFNTANQGANYDAYCTLNYCCTTPQPANAFGNITNAPVFVDPLAGDLRLQSNSPCINAGRNTFAPAGPDLDGNPRTAGGTVDIGAYEFQSPASQISYAWLQQYGLPINSSTDTADPDGDGVDNYHEWLAGTDPTNPLSSPAQLTITPSGIAPSGITLTWSTNAVGFSLQSTTNLLPPVTWVTNFPAPVVVNGMKTVTNAITGPQQFYRLIH